MTLARPVIRPGLAYGTAPGGTVVWRTDRSCSISASIPRCRSRYARRTRRRYTVAVFFVVNTIRPRPFRVGNLAAMSADLDYPVQRPAQRGPSPWRVKQGAMAFCKYVGCHLCVNTGWRQRWTSLERRLGLGRSAGRSPDGTMIDAGVHDKPLGELVETVSAIMRRSARRSGTLAASGSQYVQDRPPRQIFFYRLPALLPGCGVPQAGGEVLIRWGRRQRCRNIFFHSHGGFSPAKCFTTVAAAGDEESSSMTLQHRRAAWHSHMFRRH